VAFNAGAEFVELEKTKLQWQKKTLGIMLQDDPREWLKHPPVQYSSNKYGPPDERINDSECDKRRGTSSEGGGRRRKNQPIDDKGERIAQLMSEEVYLVVFLKTKKAACLVTSQREKARLSRTSPRVRKEA